MKILWRKKTNGAAYDISSAVTTVTWSGSVEQAAREVSISVLNAPNDPNITKLKLNIAAGDVIELFEDGRKIFLGEIQTSEKLSEIGTITYNARDMMDHMLRIEHKAVFKNKTAENITKRLCKIYGITTGPVKTTKKVIKKLIIDGNNIYDCIMMAYTKAARSTGEKYMCYMDGTKLCTKVKGTIVENYSLDEYINISGAGYEETIENMVNQVKIYNDKGKQIGVVKNGENIKRYGIYQSIYTKESGVNATAAAKNLLTDVEKKVNVNSIDGNLDCTSGNGVIVRDKATGLNGLFLIQNDTHTWENGQHKMSLELDFRNIMDAKEVDEEKKKKKKTGSGKSKEFAGTYKVSVTNAIMRDAPGRKNKRVEVIRYGEIIKCDGRYTYVSGTPWLWGTHNGNSGYVYKRYIDKE